MKIIGRQMLHMLTSSSSASAGLTGQPMRRGLWTCPNTQIGTGPTVLDILTACLNCAEFQVKSPWAIANVSIRPMWHSIKCCGVFPRRSPKISEFRPADHLTEHRVRLPPPSPLLLDGLVHNRFQAKADYLQWQHSYWGAQFRMVSNHKRPWGPGIGM